MSRPKICVSIVAGGYIQVIEAIRCVEPHEPDLVEVRIDFLDNWKGLEMIRSSTDLPLIATNRRADQGGRNHGTEDDRVASILEACDLGFDYVDLEITTADLRLVIDEVRKSRTKLIVSFHDLHETPSTQTLDEIYKEELSFKPDVCKIIGYARSYNDNLSYLNFLRSKPNVNLTCFAMGSQGIVSRILAPLFGGAFTYASAQTGRESAPGQLTIEALREFYRLLGV
jgi:3-dehydroquinate dehydratase type I